MDMEKDKLLKEKIKDFTYKPNMLVKDFVGQFKYIGYQATHLGKAVEIIKRMKKDNAKIYLSFTSNMVSSGLRGFFAQLIKMRFVDVIVTTVGSIEEDIIKAKNPGFYVGSFSVDDEELGKMGINRIGNIFVPNETYESFEDIITPILNELYQIKKQWTPSELIYELGRFVDDENSIVYQARKNDVKIYCPAITDGALGMQLFFFYQRHKDFVIDVVKDMDYLLKQVMDYDKTGAIILGGGVSKHHVILANLMRNGMEYAVYITTAHAYAGSLSGATTDEAKSWGKIKGDSDAITINGDATILFPLIMTKVLDDLNEEKNTE